MDISKSVENGTTIFTIKGRMDAVTSPDAEKELAAAFQDGAKKVLIDLKELDYISSAGLRVLLVAAKTTQQQKGKLALSALTDIVKEVFEISGFSSIFNIFPASAEALAFLDK